MKKKLNVIQTTAILMAVTFLMMALFIASLVPLWNYIDSIDPVTQFVLVMVIISVVSYFFLYRKYR